MYPQIPPRVEYQLTPLGKSVLPLIEQLANWAEENIATIKKNRKRHAEKKHTTNTRRVAG